jgi:hypothetical protein
MKSIMKMNATIYTLYFIIFRWDCNIKMDLNPLNADLNPIRHLLALLGAHHILHVSRIRVKEVGWWGMDRIDSAQDGQVSGSCEHSNELPGSIQYGEFFD